MKTRWETKLILLPSAPDARDTLLPNKYTTPEDLFENVFKTESPEHLQNIATYIIVSEKRRKETLDAPN